MKTLKSKTQSTPRYQEQVKQCIINPEKAAPSFKRMKTQGRSGSQNQSKRKTASTVTTTFSDKNLPQRKFASVTTQGPEK